MQTEASNILRDINARLTEFEKSWDSSQLADLLRHPRASSVGWKVADIELFTQISASLISQTSQLHIGDVNNRKIGSFVVRTPLQMDIPVIKLMQRRPGSDDALGFDHVDFTVKDLAVAEKVLVDQDISYEWQENPLHRWISFRLASGEECKLIDHSVLDVCAQELRLASDSLQA